MKKTLVLTALLVLVLLALAAPALAVKPADPLKAQNIDWYQSSNSDVVSGVRDPRSTST